LDAYRASLFLLHVAKADVRRLIASGSDKELTSQLIRGAGSVSANISEGYSRPTRADRLRFLGYALGSTRECVTWYLATADETESPQILGSRLVLLARTRALLLGLIRSTRSPRNRGTGSEFEP
jgi:four helix bundle protein